MADERAQQALDGILAGEKLLRHEPRVAYNGAAGVPIREQVLERRGEQVLTRNVYGARCLNSPNACFLDIDFPTLHFGEVARMSAFPVLVVAVIAGLVGHSILIGIAAFIALVLAFYCYGIVKERRLPARAVEWRREAIARVEAFSKAHADWGMRLYNTPNGLRVLLTHREFAPTEPEVQQCFSALQCDPVYVAMCQRQQCFRARVSPKPWRIGMKERLRPRPGTWPVKPSWLPIRDVWIQKYEALAASYASCRFVAQLGEQAVAASLRDVVEWHDEMCGAHSQRQLA